MDKHQAIKIATEEVHKIGYPIKNEPPFANRRERGMSLDRKAPGWDVSFLLDIPDGFEANMLFLEIYDDGRIYVHDLL